MNGPWDRLSYLLCSLFPTPGKPALCSLEGQLQADSRQLKIILALIEDSWVPPPPNTHTHTHPFHSVPKITFPNLFGTAGCVQGASSSPAHPERTREWPGLLIAFALPGVWGRKEGAFWGHHQYGA